jgi:hypothetical protein
MFTYKRVAYLFLLTGMLKQLHVQNILLENWRSKVRIQKMPSPKHKNSLSNLSSSMEKQSLQVPLERVKGTEKASKACQAF